MNTISDDLFHFHIIPYLGVKELLMYSCTNKQNKEYIENFIETFGKHHILKFLCTQRKKKEQFFHDHITNLSIVYLHGYDILKTFSIIEDMYHGTSFTKDVLKVKKFPDDMFHPNTDSKHRDEMSIRHRTFYGSCMEEIELYYHNLYIKLKKKYNIILK
jgi:hypothetical protein